MVQHRLWSPATVRRPQPVPLPGDGAGEKLQDFILYQRLETTRRESLGVQSTNHFVSYLTLIITSVDNVMMTDGQIISQLVRYFRSEIEHYYYKRKLVFKIFSVSANC